jgi:hypothetical protein
MFLHALCSAGVQGPAPAGSVVYTKPVRRFGVLFAAGGCFLVAAMRGSWLAFVLLWEVWILSLSRLLQRPPRSGVRPLSLAARPLRCGPEDQQCGSQCTAAGRGSRPLATAAVSAAVEKRNGVHPDVV